MHRGAPREAHPWRTQGCCERRQRRFPRSRRRRAPPLRRLDVAGGRRPVTAAGRNPGCRAVHDGQVVVEVRVAGQRYSQFGVVLGIIPATAPELGLGEKCQRLTGKPHLEPGPDPLHRHSQVVVAPCRSPVQSFTIPR